MNILIDTNIFFSALLKDSTVRKIIKNQEYLFLFPLIIFEEFKKYGGALMQKSGLDAHSFRKIVIEVLKHVKLVKTSLFENKFDEATQIMKNIDEKDSVFLACAMVFNCPIWSDDKHFKRQNKNKTLTTKEMINLLKNP